MNSLHNFRKEVLLGGVLQGPIIRFLFFIFLCDIIFVMSGIDVDSYSDESTPYFAADNMAHVFRNIRK